MAEPSWKDSWRALAFGSSFAGIKKELSPAIAALEKIPWEGEFTFRSDPWAGLIASWGSLYPMR